jgi:hypothetical protein
MIYSFHALVQPEPTLGDREVEPSLVFRQRALELTGGRRVELLDIDPAIEKRLERVGELD